MSFDQTLKSLEASTSTEALVDNLRTLNRLYGDESRGSDVKQLRIASVLLNRIIPETYDLAQGELKDVLLDSLANRVALSQLINQIKTQDSRTLEKCLKDLVSSDRLFHLLDGLDGRGPYYRSIKSLLLLKLPQCLNEIYVKTGTAPPEYMGRSFDAALTKCPVLIEGLMEEDNSLAGRFFMDPKVYRQLLDSHPTGLFKSLCKYMNSKPFGPPKAYLSLLSSLDVPNSELISAASTIAFPLSKVLLAMASVDYETVLQYTRQFGSKSYIDRVPVAKQTQFAQFLIVLASYTKDQLEQLSRDPAFLDAVTNRLNSSIPACRSLGMILADYVHTQTKGEPLFKANESTEFMQDLGEFPLQNDMTHEEACQALKDAVPEVPRIKTQITEPPVIKTLTIDSDPEDSDDDTERVQKVAIPVYLKELVGYLTTDPNAPLAYEKQQMAHMVAPQMIRAKKGLQELSYYSSSLMDQVMNMDNKYNFDDFNAWKLSTMIAITVSDFDNATEQLEQVFIEGDIPVSERVMILSCLSLSSRELAGGYDDPFVLGKEGLDEFEPKTLPDALHRQFLPFEDRSLNQLTSSINDLQMDAISAGNIIRRSTALDKHQVLSKDTRFINKRLPKLVYSLVGIWETVNSVTGRGFNLGELSTLLNVEYFRTLSLLYEVAAPSSIELVGITRDILLVILKQLHHLLTDFDQELFDTVLKCLREILQVDQSIVPSKDLFYSEIVAAYDILTKIASSDLIVEDRLKGNTAYIIRQLAEIAGFI